MIPNGLKRRVKETMHKYPRLAEAAATTIGHLLSTAAERKFRQKLVISPPVVEFTTCPSGGPLPRPIRMQTCNGRDQVSNAIYHYGWERYERPFPALLEATFLTVPEGAFLDIGANTGVYSLLCRAICPRRKIYSFEPFPPVLDILKTNLALSGFAEEVAVVDLAVSDKEGVAELFVPTQEHGLVETSASLYSGFKSRHGDIVTIRTVRLDDFMRENDVGRVAVIKIDVEGAEDMVLNGAIDLIQRDLPVIFCEILKHSQALPAIEETLAGMGYLRAAVHERALVTEVNQLSADNHILFPKSMEATVRHIALQQMCEMMAFQGHCRHPRRGCGR